MITRPSTQRRFTIVLGIVLVCVSAFCSSANALNPSLDVNQYPHTAWNFREGFIKGVIWAITQTPDGYLWLGTDQGLVRFDGFKFVPLQLPAGQTLPSNVIVSLMSARDGTLWIGTQEGLVSWKDNKPTQYPELNGYLIGKLVEDRDGVIWAPIASPVTRKWQVCRIEHANVQIYGQNGGPGAGALGLFQDSKGTLWVGTTNGVWRWKPGEPKFFQLEDMPNGIQGLSEDDDGGLLISLTGGLKRLVDGTAAMKYPLPMARQTAPIAILRDHDGGLWIGTQGSGVVHIHQGITDIYTESDGLSGDAVFRFFEDREGNIWVASTNGLDRFREVTVTSFSTKQGLANPLAQSLLATSDGSVWVGSFEGLNRVNHGQVTIYRERRPMNPSAHASPSSREVREINGSGLPNGIIESIFQDSLGRVWVSTLKGVGYIQNDRFVSVDGLPGGFTRAFAEDSQYLWVANQDRGLFRAPLNGGGIQNITWAQLGHRDQAMALAADTSKPGLWLGFGQGGIVYFADGQIRSSFSPKDGLATGRVISLTLARDGTLWVATEGGLSRIKDGRVATLTSRNGLPCDSAEWIIEDDPNWFWIGTTCGLARITHSEMEAWNAAADSDKNRKQSLQLTLFDNSDGVRLSSRSYYGSPAVRATDGKLWLLSAGGGLSVIDPNHLPFNRLLPPVHIEQIVADRKTYDATMNSGGQLRLPPLSRDLEIDYTALSLAAPEKILFRYKLEGYDSDWQEAGNRRQAFYTNLSPRKYRFRVMAANNSGVWNEVGTYLDFSIAPAYYQTTWFRILLGVLFLIVLGAIYQMRLKQVASQVRGRMEERLEERERIARDLHDTLLQSVQGLILKFHAVATKIQRDDPAYAALENALDRADEVLAEGRDRIRNLRVDVESLSDLPAAFQAVAKSTMKGGDVTFRTVVEGKERKLHLLVMHESFAIGREALVNALTHSEARQVEVEVIYEPREFRLRVRDDGRGIDPTILAQGGRTNHWGLQGMRERAQRIGAKVEIWSRSATGTEIELTVPGNTAYLTARSHSIFSRLRSPSASERKL